MNSNDYMKKIANVLEAYYYAEQLSDGKNGLGDYSVQKLLEHTKAKARSHLEELLGNLNEQEQLEAMQRR